MLTPEPVSRDQIIALGDKAFSRLFVLPDGSEVVPSIGRKCPPSGTAGDGGDIDFFWMNVGGEEEVVQVAGRPLERIALNGGDGRFTLDLHPVLWRSDW